MGKPIVSMSYHGNFSKLEKEFEKLKNIFNIGILDKYGVMGVEYLKDATPKDTGKTSESWYYEITQDKDGATVTWKNSNVNKGVNIALVIQYGHGMPNGAYIEGIDYINPALQKVFKEIEENVQKEVKNVL